MDMELISVENAKRDFPQNTILKNISGFALKRYFCHCSKKINNEIKIFGIVIINALFLVFDCVCGVEAEPPVPPRLCWPR